MVGIVIGRNVQSRVSAWFIKHDVFISGQSLCVQAMFHILFFVISCLVGNSLVHELRMKKKNNTLSINVGKIMRSILAGLKRGNHLKCLAMNFAKTWFNVAGTI